MAEHKAIAHGKNKKPAKILKARDEREIPSYVQRYRAVTLTNQPAVVVVTKRQRKLVVKNAKPNDATARLLSDF